MRHFKNLSEVSLTIFFFPTLDLSQKIIFLVQYIILFYSILFFYLCVILFFLFVNKPSEKEKLISKVFFGIIFLSFVWVNQTYPTFNMCNGKHIL